MKELLKKFFEELGMFVDFEAQSEPDSKVEKGEKVIGEMNDLEKGLYNFIEQKNKEHKEIEEKAVLLADQKKKEKEKAKLVADHAKNHRVTEIVRKIMWASIEGRFQTSEESTGMGIRKDFKIVETFEEESSMSGFGMGAIIPGVGVIISHRIG